MIKLSVIAFTFILFSGHIKVLGQSYNYTNIGIFYFKGGNSLSGRSEFVNYHLITENNFNVLKNISLGLGYNYSKNAVNYDHTVNTYLNYRFPLNKLLFFTGVGISFGKKVTYFDNSFHNKNGIQPLFQGGIRGNIYKNLFVQLEIGNFRYKSGIVPTVGLGFKY